MASAMWCSACAEERLPDEDAGGCCPLCGGTLTRRGAEPQRPLEFDLPARLEEAIAAVGRAGTDPARGEDALRGFATALGSHLQAVAATAALDDAALPDQAADLAAGAALEGGGGGSGNGASPAALASLLHAKIEKNSWILYQTSLTLSNGGAAATVPAAATTHVDALFAGFSPPPATAVTAPMVLAEPATCHPAINNSAALAGCVAVVERGGCTFAAKALRAQAAGAVAVVVIQTADVWPL